MTTGNQKKTGIPCSRCSIKQVYSAHKVTERMEISDVPNCSTVATNHIQGDINSWKGSLNQVLEGSYLYLNGDIWIYLGILVQFIYYNKATQAAMIVKNKRLHQKRWFNTVLLSNWAVLKNNFIYIWITVIYEIVSYKIKKL